MREVIVLLKLYKNNVQLFFLCQARIYRFNIETGNIGDENLIEAN